MEKSLSNYEIMQSLMKVVKFIWILIFLTFMLLSTQTVVAQDEDEDTGSDTCIFSTFCVVTLFILFLIYLSSRRKNRDYQYEQATNIPRYPPGQPDYRYPSPPTYRSPGSRGKQGPSPQKTEMKCDLCNSKNLRVFEDGYYKCNDCRHVFYHTEYTRRSR